MSLMGSCSHLGDMLTEVNFALGQASHQEKMGLQQDLTLTMVVPQTVMMILQQYWTLTIVVLQRVMMTRSTPSLLTFRIRRNSKESQGPSI
jgi:hypothetical protein